jgi:multiple sugar transport system ATP-binding protein
VADVALAKLTRRYDGDPNGGAAVRDLDLAIASGELLVIVGPSGCGKSTTLRLIAGLEEPDGGSVSIGGRSMAKVPPQDRDVAMVFQGYALYPHMKVRDILAFPLKMRGVDKGERARAVEETANLLGITRLLERRPSELSGGERQRVAMGRAIVRRPKVFLFDEPLSNLDPVLRGELRVEIGALVHRFETTSIYVTHDQVEAMTLGDRIAVMRAGRLEQLGTPREVYTRPATSFVAGFLGSPPMNLVALGAGAGALGTRMLSLPRREAAHARAHTAGIRPEHVRLSGAPRASASSSDTISVAATVVASEPLGAETQLLVDAGGDTVRVRVPGLDAPPRGGSVSLTFEPSDIHWFDEEGRRL